MNFRDAASLYVSLGWKIFPLMPGTKLPFKGSKGVHDATDDAMIIDQWHYRAPDSNISVATGVSNLIIVDIDCKPPKDGKPKPNGFQTLDHLARQRRVLPMTVHSRTRSGGLHLYFRLERPWPVGYKKKLGPGIDLQTGGLGAILPPSVIHADKVDDGMGGAYEWLRAPLGPNLPTLPQWVFDYTKPPPPPKYKPGAMPSGEVERRLDGAIRSVLAAAPGHRNNELNRQAHLVGRLIVEGGLSPSLAESKLLEAALAINRTQQEAIATIRSGMRSGIKNAGGSASG